MMRPFLSRPLGLSLALLSLLVIATDTRAQQGGGMGMGSGAEMTYHPPDNPDFRLKSPVLWQVFQRDQNDTASVPLVIAGDGLKVQDVSVNHLSGNPVADAAFEGGKVSNIPVGGPYTAHYTVVRGNEAVGTFNSAPFFVGDLWVLAGQSNMEGVGDLVDVTPPHASVAALGMDGKWVQAKEPLHWLVDSPDPVHSGDASTREQRSKDQHASRRKGAGLGLPFGVAMVGATGVPVGLVAAAHGGTSMAQWDPAKKGEGGNSLYGSMVRQVQLAGGKVKGVLWYQGESDANPDAAKVFPKVFGGFIAAVRSDLGQPDLPFYYVQIGRFIREQDPKPWNAVQDAQRTLVDAIPNTAVISIIDLELDDLIHVGTRGLKRAGQRLARIALREQFGQVGATTPTLDKVFPGAGETLIVKFKGVNFRSRSGQEFGGQPFSTQPGQGMGGGQGMMGRDAGPGFRQMGGGMGMGGMPATLARETTLGLQPAHHIAGFSIRKADGAEIPLIYEALVGPSRDAVILKLASKPPAGAQLWYGYGLDPYCNLTDSLDMAVPVFGPIALDPKPE
ncbi:sialate O-acetylesterase [Isosphaeraceae bacterium EP7]